jgi:mycothiol synthase
MNATSPIIPVDLKTIQGELAVELNRHHNAIRSERLPEDPPIPLEESIQGWRNNPEYEEISLWVARNPDQTRVLASGEVHTWKVEDNRHLAWFEIAVEPEYRRQGIAKRLLGLITNEVQQRGRRLLMAQSNDRAPAGAIFLQHIGARPGLEGRTNQLRISELDRSLMEKWHDRSDLFDYEMVFQEGAYPEDFLPAIVELFKIGNDEPRGELEIEDQVITGEQLREMDAYHQARGSIRWTIYTRHKPDGRLCGFTEVFWNPNRPTILEQSFTGVHSDFRGHGLGRWMKANMMLKVLDERPMVALVRTGNANCNAPMLAINDAMGFKPYTAHTTWQVELEKVQEYLKT